MDNKDKQVEDRFRQAFDQFEVPPPDHNWEQIEEEMEELFDEQFHKKMAPFQVTPKPRVWKKIKSELPLHPGAHRYISWMTRIAAVLVIGMLLTIFVDQQQQTSGLSQKMHPIPPSPPTNTPAAHEAASSGEFVFDVKNKNRDSNHPRKYNAQEEEELKLLLQSILEDDDELAAATDPAVIDNSLQIATALPNGLTLVVPENDQTDPTPADQSVELEIKIPLKVVESDLEAETLIHIYESSQGKNAIGVD